MKGTRNGTSPQSLILGISSLLGGIKPGGVCQWLRPPLRAPTVQEATLDRSQYIPSPEAISGLAVPTVQIVGVRDLTCWSGPLQAESLWLQRRGMHLLKVLLESFQKLYEFQNLTFPRGKLETGSFLGCFSAAEIKH